MDGFLRYSLVSALVCGLCFWLARVGVPWVLAKRGVHYRRKTKFGPAMVFETADEDGTTVRLLNVGGAYQSAAYVDEPLRNELVCVYHRVFAQVLCGAFGRTWPLEIAVLGGGGYSFPRWCAAHLPGARITAVEIDPAVTELARDFFFLDEAEGSASGRLVPVNADAWPWLEAQEDASLRVIVNDAFSRVKPLGPMETGEGARIIHAKLSDDGIYLANVIAPLEGRRSRVLYDTNAVFEAEFAHVYLVPERPEEPRRAACNVLVASDRALDVPEGYSVVS